MTGDQIALSLLIGGLFFAGLLMVGYACREHDEDAETR
jgi:hypothetical protein